MWGQGDGEEQAWKSGAEAHPNPGNLILRWPGAGSLHCPLCPRPLCPGKCVHPPLTHQPVARLNFLFPHKVMPSSIWNFSSCKWGIPSTLAPANDVRGSQEPQLIPQRFDLPLAPQINWTSSLKLFLRSVFSLSMHSQLTKILPIPPNPGKLPSLQASSLFSGPSYPEGSYPEGRSGPWTACEQP